VYPLYHFYAIFSVCGDLQGGSRITIWGDSLKRFQGCGVLNMTPVTPKFYAPSSGEAMRRIPKRFRDAKTCSKSSITMPVFVGVWISHAAGRTKNVEFFCLCVCRSRSWTTKFERTTLPRRRWNLEVIFISLDMGSTEHFQRQLVLLMSQNYADIIFVKTSSIILYRYSLFSR